MTSMKLTVAAGAVALAALGWSPAAHADDQPSCTAAQIVVTALPLRAGAGHRGVPLEFSLTPGSAPCTLTGYPGVDSSAGGPPIHAQRTLRGYLGGLPEDVDAPPTVTLAPGSPAEAIVEGVAVDADGNPCPTYTGLWVTPPDTSGTVGVPVVIDTCELQVHPVTGAVTRDEI